MFIAFNSIYNINEGIWKYTKKYSLTKNIKNYPGCASECMEKNKFYSLPQ